MAPCGRGEASAAPVNNKQPWDLVQVRLCPAFAVTAELFYALALAIALFEQPQVVLHVFVAGILALCSRERRVRAFVVTTQTRSPDC